MNEDNVNKAYNEMRARKAKMEPTDIVGQLQRMLLFTFYDAEKTTKAELAHLLKTFMRIKTVKNLNLFNDGSTLAKIKMMRDNANHFNNLMNEILSDLANEFIENNKEPSEYIRSHILAKRLNVSRGTVTNWIKNGYIGNIKRVGRKIDIPITEVEKLIRYFPKYRPFWERDFRM
jgi:excisionase family DNA binding protein